MKITKPIFITIGILLILTIAGAYVFFSFIYVEPVYLNPSATIENVNVQPKEAISMAEPYLEEHATYSYRDDKPLQTHIVRHKDWYYVMRTNYPAKNAGYYMQPAVKVNAFTKEIDFSERN